MERRRYLPEAEGELTPAEAKELEQIDWLYPEQVEKNRKMVERRLSYKKGPLMARYAGRGGG